jgi:hypothetical protein
MEDVLKKKKQKSNENVTKRKRKHNKNENENVTKRDNVTNGRKKRDGSRKTQKF